MAQLWPISSCMFPTSILSCIDIVTTSAVPSITYLTLIFDAKKCLCTYRTGCCLRTLMSDVMTYMYMYAHTHTCALCCCSKKEIVRPWFREDDTKERNEKARNAYEALMTVTLRKPDSDDYRNFSIEVKQRAKDEYGDFDYDEEEVRLVGEKRGGGGRGGK